MTYSQSTGTLTLARSCISGCYAGHLEYKNKPEFQNLFGRGPIPQGKYTLGPLHPAGHLGPAMVLTPNFDTAQFIESLGREPYSFYVHLDNPAHAGASSDGCIVAPSFMAIEQIEAARKDGDTGLEVMV